MPYDNLRKVWHSNYVDVMLFAENADGNVIHNNVVINPFNPLAPLFAIPSLLTYCYLQNASLSVGLSGTERRPVTGRSHRKLTIGEYDDCTLEAEHFFYRKADEVNLDNVFNRRKRLRVVCKLMNPEYGAGVAPLENDLCQLTRALGNRFGISVPENDVLRGQATFLAEEFL